MTLPGFNAETSLYKTTVHYRLMGALVQADGVTLQQFPFGCGPCYLTAQGACVQDCAMCTPFPLFHCFRYRAPCSPSACQPRCCPPGFHCCGDCLPGRCVPDPFSDQGCVPLRVRCR
jgi:hypothetical protein